MSCKQIRARLKYLQVKTPMFTACEPHNLNMNFGSYGFRQLYRASLAQLVTCLTAEPGVASLILARSHTLAEIDHEIISTAIISILWRRLIMK